MRSKIENGCRLKLVADQGERSVVLISFTGDKLVGMRVTSIHIFGRKAPYHGSYRSIFGNRCIVKSDVRGDFIHVQDREDQDFFDKQATVVGAANANRIARSGLEIERLGSDQGISDDRKLPVVIGTFSGHQRVDVGVCLVGIRGRQVSNGRASLFIFVNG